MMLKDHPSQPNYNIARRLLKAGLLVWNRFTARGAENVPATGGCIIVSNHASFLDPPILGAGVRHRQVRFMARDTLFEGRFMGWLMPSIGVIPLDRTRGDIGALRKAIQLLKAGAVIGLFPEGTRTHDGNLQAPKGGIGFLIAKAGVPVVPAYIAGSFRAYPRGARFIRPTNVSIIFGTPIPPAELAALATEENGYEKIAQLAMKHIAALRAP
ncbi:MAG: 1-acyl-sn-glycerol-3-phosphate acyltransferase [Verrucomicrobia bacterium]|nr:MAG: 1-acyl-sn-glycerol-3-phosphate acyltransferase [Verrucomicrobiota bacterium]